MIEELDERRKLLVDGLRSLELETAEPRGAFYAFPSVAGLVDERGSAGFCEDLLEAEALAIVPGTAFGMEGHVRLAYSIGAVRVREALVRLGRFVESRR